MRRRQKSSVGQYSVLVPSIRTDEIQLERRKGCLGASLTFYSCSSNWAEIPDFHPVKLRARGDANCSFLKRLSHEIDFKNFGKNLQN